MKWFLRIFFVLVLANICVGYAIRQDNLPLGEKWIGFSVLAGFGVFMPLFLAHRWKGKRLQDYTLSSENLNKMKETLEPNKKKKRS